MHREDVPFYKLPSQSEANQGSEPPSHEREVRKRKNRTQKVGDRKRSSSSRSSSVASRQMLGERSQDTPSDTPGIIGSLKERLHTIKYLHPGRP